jgi:hypothetical protein
MNVKTAVKAGVWPASTNHNEALVRAGGLKVQTSIKAGVRQVKARAKARPKARPRLKVGTGLKAGLQPCL